MIQFRKKFGGAAKGGGAAWIQPIPSPSRITPNPLKTLAPPQPPQVGGNYGWAMQSPQIGGPCGRAIPSWGEGRAPRVGGGQGIGDRHLGNTPPTRRTTTRLLAFQGKGPWISSCPSLSKASPAPFLGRAAKFLT
jgi:hypothetical protein